MGTFDPFDPVKSFLCSERFETTPCCVIQANSAPRFCRWTTKLEESLSAPAQSGEVPRAIAALQSPWWRRSLAPAPPVSSGDFMCTSIQSS